MCRTEDEEWKSGITKWMSVKRASSSEVKNVGRCPYQPVQCLFPSEHADGGDEFLLYHRDRLKSMLQVWGSLLMLSLTPSALISL